MLIDTHCHLYYEELKNDIKGVLKRAHDLDVNRFICVATNLEDARECLSLAEIHNNIFASVGIHPHDAKDTPDDYVDQIIDLITFDSMVALGEMGLDYFRNITDPSIQKKVFRDQMEVAQKFKYPIIFHNRDADEDVIEVLADYPEVIGVAHCFSSNLKTAQSFLEMGYYISFSGNLTFKNSHLPEVAKDIPLDRVMVETDSPYLSPAPFRGKPNEPGRTRYVAEKLAEIHALPFEEIAKHTTENAVELFRLP
ncbi:MAG: TatD family hydrolase [Candidatus Marinimicrobia bacterium]|nr:TatD family hydrolase [Candidatus Neomarinimicrobiota bacterium]MBL7010732.1 TatD family hydrolase [Candidatus Neomarinimicrobiota bacterium]MBL7030836.1 TatD family hydrolase [Candidatus Neomarinimicrobiota bacterium]